MTPHLRHRRLHRLARRYLNPVVLRLGLAGGRHSPIGLVLHVGRHSGRAYATPLAVHRIGDRCYVPLTYGPAAHWCQNVLATGSCRIRLGGREIGASRPAVVGRAALPPRLRRFYRLAGIREFLELRRDVDHTGKGVPPAGVATGARDSARADGTVGRYAESRSAR